MPPPDAERWPTGRATVHRHRLAPHHGDGDRADRSRGLRQWDGRVWNGPVPPGLQDARREWVRACAVAAAEHLAELEHVEDPDELAAMVGAAHYELCRAVIELCWASLS